MKYPLKHCGLCGSKFIPDRATAKWCSLSCSRKARWSKTKKERGLAKRHCRQCGKTFEIKGRAEANRWHCTAACAVQSARESRSKFYVRNPGKAKIYYKKSREKLGPDGNLKRFYARFPDAPRACQSCGETRVLDVAHKPAHRRNGAWRSVANTNISKVWILCPTCHSLLDRMHYSPSDLGLN